MRLIFEAFFYLRINQVINGKGRVSIVTTTQTITIVNKRSDQLPQYALY